MEMISKKPFFSWVLERYRGLQFLLFVLTLTTVFFRVFPLEMQKRIINYAIALQKIDVLLVYCGLYLGAVFVAGVLKYIINVLQGYIGQKILLEMRARLYDHILTLPLPFFRKMAPGTVIASLTSELNVIGEFMGGAIAVPVINLLTLLTFAGYMAYLNPLLAFLSLSIYPVEILIVPFLQRRFNRLNQERIELNRSLSNTVSEAISGMHEVHGNASYQVESGKLARFAVPLFKIRCRMNTFKFLTKFFNNFFQSLGPFVLFLLGGYLTIQGRLDLGALVAFLSAYEKLYDPWKELMDYYQSYQDSRVRYRQVMGSFDLKPEGSLRPEDGREPFRLKGEVQVHDLSYVAEGHIRILDQISLELKPGEQLAVVGFSGSGKSTLAMIIGQLYTYNTGHVMIDGIELKSMTRLDVSRNFGYVAQYPFIFDGSIMENILYGLLSSRDGKGDNGALADRGEILRVLDQVGFSDDVLRMGLDRKLSPVKHRELAEKLVFLRDAYHSKWGQELANLVDSFVVNRFQQYSSILENIVFGYPNRKDLELWQLPSSRFFLDFLKETGLREPLLELGVDLAVETVALLKDLQDDAFFFEMSPIAIDEFEQYTVIVDRLLETGRERIAKKDGNALLLLALRFVPARHKMAALSHRQEEAILAARRRFIERMIREDPEAFTFYHPTEYFYSQSILNNLLFGNLKEEQPQTMEQIRRSVVDLLNENDLIDEIMEQGLEFQVGSKGDRLSGGQKQKIGLLRALLKKTPILILDEATASLDNASQARIQDLLRHDLKGRSTLIAVVHRLEMVRGFDRIAVMKGGRIVEMGRYEELMSQGGLFYELAGGTQSTL